ncbi:RrF2 family transcriptional regulator [Melioribacter sp. OK-6-Me]|uniref:RrF2 family transcriptional regulator n=1 Tax=unclassified Melioribacter TaxID=2627329 RepID=UPI003EDADD1C
MKLSTRSRYGVKILLEIAIANANTTRGENVPVTIKDIAVKQKISEKYLSKLIITLKGAGLIKSFRGTNGGYLLARQPSEINMLNVVKVLEGDLLISEVSRSDNYCPVENMWVGLRSNIEDYLRNINLNDLLEDYTKHNTKAISFEI